MDLPTKSLDHFEFFEPRFIDREPETGRVVIKVDAPIYCLRLAVEDVPEQLVADLHIDYGKILRQGRIETRHHQMVVVHLSRMRNHRNGMSLGQGGDLARLG